MKAVHCYAVLVSLGFCYAILIRTLQTNEYYVVCIHTTADMFVVWWWKADDFFFLCSVISRFLHRGYLLLHLEEEGNEF